MPHTKMSHWQADVVVAVALLPVVLLPLAVGGVHPEVQVAFAVVELVCALAWVLLSVVQKRPLYAPWTALPFALGVVATALEVLPLPNSVLALVAPHTAETRSFVVAALPLEVRERVLSVVSMDPPETKAALVRLIGAVALTFVVANGARRRERARLIWRMLLGGALALLLVAVAHTVVGVGAWGSFSRHRGVLFAPMVNGNHMSKVFGALSMLAFGRALACRVRDERLVAAAIGVGCSVAVVLTLSRGGVAAWIAAVAVAIVLLVRARAHSADDRRPWHHLIVPGCVVLVAIGVGVVAATDRAIVDEVTALSDEFQRNQSKVSLWPPALDMLDETSLTGTGNNAFGAAFTAQSRANTMYDAEVTFTHVENIVIATVVEHGVFAGILLLSVSIVVGVRLLQQLQSRAEAAALPAVILLVVGDLVDFSLESGAGIAVLATALGLCAGALPEPRRTTAPASAASVLVLAALVTWHAPLAVTSWRYRDDAAIAASPRNTLQQALQQKLAAHPFDAVRCAELATEARSRRQPREALLWANRAINLWPTLPAGHLEAARALVVTGHLEQAMLEYREAAQGRSGERRTLLEAFRRTTDVNLRRIATGTTPEAQAVLASVLANEGRFDDAMQIADLYVAQPGLPVHLRADALRYALSLPNDDAVRERLSPLRPTPDGIVAATVAQAIERLEGVEAALRAVDTWSLRAPGPALRWELATALRIDDLPRALTTVGALRAQVRTAHELDELDDAEALALAKAGAWAKRLVVLEHRAARQPKNAAVLVEIGLTELELGRDTDALNTARRIQTIKPGPNRLQKRLDAVK